MTTKIMSKHRLNEMNAVDRLASMDAAHKRCVTFEAHVEKNGTETNYTQHTSLERDSMDRPQISDWRKATPHWKSSSDGYRHVEIVIESDGALAIRTTESAVDTGAKKEAWANLTPAGARALADLINAALEQHEKHH